MEAIAWVGRPDGVIFCAVTKAVNVIGLSSTKGTTTHTTTHGLTPRDVDDDAEVIIRAWTPHPEKSVMADAPARAVLPAARELRGLTMYVSSQVDSRLAGSGLLLLPQGIESMHSQSDDADAEELGSLTNSPTTCSNPSPTATAPPPWCRSWRPCRRTSSTKSNT